ncbi:hypothetical protein DVU_1393 [Nitratidesulfovibrio vulgaris str. Hildenborough]|uniref:Uncharacterized protein n=1 Tax=Nitratidesulfovibrio vulgaris (strain ATCC 29579 / DSM 644 / CCUG 34227 / NCIMB 8303 / VKM B-1760 / Hildenborough) TaxID=882 RepID=Q72C91_NITV2|nr:hypothetical protein DVU_1393 [Nitratidesulfovibrio vulgaris str. Hildenborough]
MHCSSGPQRIVRKRMGMPWTALCRVRFLPLASHALSSYLARLHRERLSRVTRHERRKHDMLPVLIEA